MKVFKTNVGKGIYLTNAELLSLGFICVNLLGQTGYSFLDDYADKTVSRLLSDYQLYVLNELLNAIREENTHVR